MAMPTVEAEPNRLVVRGRATREGAEPPVADLKTLALYGFLLAFELTLVALVPTPLGVFSLTGAVVLFLIASSVRHRTDGVYIPFYTSGSCLLAEYGRVVCHRLWRRSLVPIELSWTPSGWLLGGERVRVGFEREQVRIDGYAWTWKSAVPLADLPILQGAPVPIGGAAPIPQSLLDLGHDAP